jgi:hypothetical protein
MATNQDLATYERLIVNIIRSLPAERVAQLADFARFLQGQSAKPAELEADDEDIEMDEALWDAQFASSEKLFARMADKVRQDIAAGRTTGMRLTRDGNIEPS